MERNVRFVLYRVVEYVFPTIDVTSDLVPMKLHTDEFSSETIVREAARGIGKNVF